MSSIMLQLYYTDFLLLCIYYSKYDMFEKVNCWQYSRDRKTIKTWELPLARSFGWMFFMLTGLITIYLVNMTNNNRLEDEIVDSVRENTKRLKHGNFLRQMTWSFCVQWFESRGILFILFFIAYCFHGCISSIYL